MSRKCSLTGKGKLKGNQISHSHIKTIKHSKPNLRHVRVSENGKVTNIKVSVRAYKSIKRGKIKNLKLALSVNK
jgi:large subunit ribosomal protein L28